MSALLRLASCVISAPPAGPAATSQPKIRMSALAERWLPQARTCALWLLRLALFITSFPSETSPLLPWLMICIDSIPVLPPSASVIASKPDSSALITRTWMLLGRLTSRLW